MLILPTVLRHPNSLILQVYEETTGLKPGDIVTGSGGALSVTLAPGIITNIFDGLNY